MDHCGPLSTFIKLRAKWSHKRGEWKSPAFLSYLDVAEFERDAVIEAHLDESSSEDEK